MFLRLWISLKVNNETKELNLFEATCGGVDWHAKGGCDGKEVATLPGCARISAILSLCLNWSQERPLSTSVYL
jgi:hypothetical protein